MEFAVSVLLEAVILSVCLLVVSTAPARADAGIPMLLIVWPSSWFLLLAIIPIEAAVAVRVLKTGWKKNLIMVSVANLASTIVGIPVTWVLLVVCQMLVGGGYAYGLDTDQSRMLAVTLQSPWLIAPVSDLPWMIPTAAAVLCVPFFFMSVFVEELSARRFVEKKSHLLLRRWSWIANSLTYGCIVLGLLGLVANILQQHFHERFGYVDLTGHYTPLPANISKNGSFSEGLAPVCSGVGGKWGYIDKNFTVVIAPQFDDAGPFSEGLAQVSIKDQRMFVDMKGNLIGKASSFKETRPFSESVGWVRVGTKWGGINKAGQLIIQPQYDDVQRFTEGLAAVSIGTKWAFIGHDGTVKIPPEFEAASTFSEGLAAVKLDDKWCYVDCSGRITITMPEDISGGNFSEGLAFFESRTDISSKHWGYIDKTGKTCIKLTVDRGEPFSEGLASFSEGLACVCTGGKHEKYAGHSTIDFSSSKHGYINKTGTFVIEPKFGYADSFSNGRAAVSVGDRWGFVDKHGNMVIPAEFTRARKFSEGLAAVGERWGIDVK